MNASLSVARSNPVPRTLLCFAAVAAIALPCRAQQTVTNTELLIRLNVRPSPAPKPALRFRLLPELNELHPGNPIQHYMKCMMEQKKFLFDEEAYQHREKLLTMPLKELPAQELKDYGRFVLSQVDGAARLDNPDWQILLKLREDGVTTLLPEVQQLRSLARALQVRFRAEIAQRQFDDAVRTAKTMFAIARHLGEHPTIIGNLVGMAIASMTIFHLDEMLDQPGCPNLYWALTSLPSPFIPLDKGMDGERVMIETTFRDLDDRAPMTEYQLKKFLADKDFLLAAAGNNPPKTRVQAWLDGRVKDQAAVTAARQRLVEYGFAEESLKRFPAGQVILLDEKREVEERFDEVLKTVRLPFWQVEALAAQNQAQKPPAVFAEALIPVTLSARQAQARIDQRFALLRHVEAVVLYSADHDGKLPATLADIAVPLPVDPVNGKPFRYEVTGNTVHLRGSTPKGQEKVPAFNVHYEITLQR
jgi:hypothetical protein